MDLLIMLDESPFSFCMGNAGPQLEEPDVVLVSLTSITKAFCSIKAQSAATCILEAVVACNGTAP